MSDYEKAIYNKGYTDGCHYGYSVGVAKPGYELKNTVENKLKNSIIMCHSSFVLNIILN